MKQSAIRESRSPRTVLITGANGFIGSNLCHHFHHRGFRVYGLVRKTSDLRLLKGIEIELLFGDLLDAEIPALPKNIDFVIHSASVVSDIASTASCRRGILDITRRLTTAVRTQCPKLRRFVYISSALTLGFDARDISETRPGKSTRFLPYSRYKKDTEGFLQDLHRKSGFPMVILRPGDVYGPGDRTSCEKMLEGIEKGVPLIVGHGKYLFAFCYVKNLCIATELACLKERATGRAYTVTNSYFPTWHEFFSGLQRGLGKTQRLYLPVAVAYAAAFLFTALHKLIPGFNPPLTYYRIKRITSDTTYDISNTISELGYRPDDDTAFQIQSIVDWYKGEKYPEEAGTGS